MWETIRDEVGLQQMEDSERGHQNHQSAPDHAVEVCPRALRQPSRGARQGQHQAGVDQQQRNPASK